MFLSVGWGWNCIQNILVFKIDLVLDALEICRRAINWRLTYLLTHQLFGWKKWPKLGHNAQGVLAVPAASTHQKCLFGDSGYLLHYSANLLIEDIHNFKEISNAETLIWNVTSHRWLYGVWMLGALMENKWGWRRGWGVGDACSLTGTVGWI